jgi:hypothetical protein
MLDTHNLAKELIKATGLTLIDAEKFKVSHINVSKSENFNLNSAINVGDYLNDEDVVIKVVLCKKTIKEKK